MEAGYIKREIESVLLEAAKYFPVITLTGPRQSGKTTTLRRVFADLPYFSLENPSTRQLAEDDPAGFLGSHESGMLLEEVHNSPHLLSYIQGIVDEHPSKRFVLSGSSNFALLKDVSQSLAGRSGVYELMPLSMSEAGAKYLERDLSELLYGGLYPAVVSGRNIPGFLYPSYVRTYLERDVRGLLNVRDLNQFDTFIRLCAGRIGSLYNASQLADEVGVTVKTVQAWMSILAASYVIFLLPPYHVNNGKRLTKAHKIYFCDTGLACSLLGVTESGQLAYDRMRGHLFENLVVCELLKRRMNKGLTPNLYFYRDSNQNEIDVVEDNGGSLNLYEIKSSSTYNSSFAKALGKADEWFSKPVLSKTVIYTGELENPEGPVRLLNFAHM